MKTVLSRLIVGSVAAFIVAHDAQAAVITSLSTDAPLAERSLVRIAVPEESFGDARIMRYWNNWETKLNYRREIGQTFVVPGVEPVEIEGFTLRIDDSRSLTNVAKGFTLLIYKTGTDGVPTGQPIYESGGLLPDDLSQLSYVTFLLDEKVVLEDGARYAFQLAFASSSGAAQLGFAMSSGELYSEGKSFHYSNSNSKDLAEMLYTTAQRDLDFTVLYSPIPEAKTTALLMVPLVGWAAYAMVGRRNAKRGEGAVCLGRISE